MAGLRSQQRALCKEQHCARSAAAAGSQLRRRAEGPAAADWKERLRVKGRGIQEPAGAERVEDRGTGTGQVGRRPPGECTGTGTGRVQHLAAEDLEAPDRCTEEDRETRRRPRERGNRAGRASSGALRMTFFLCVCFCCVCK